MEAADFLCKIQLVDEKLRFEGNCPERPEVAAVSIDAAEPIGTGAGYSPVDLLLMGLTSCVTMSLVGLLRRKGKTITTAAAATQGFMRTQPQRALARAELDIRLTAEGVEEEEILDTLKAQKVATSAVWARLSGSMDIHVAVTVQRADGSTVTARFEDPAREA